MCFRKPTTETEVNVKSIDRIPKRLLPDGPAREALLEMARSGKDVDAYTPFQTCPERQKRWNVWVIDRRWDVENWRESFTESK
jgi:hypothetical protein